MLLFIDFVRSWYGCDRLVWRRSRIRPYG